MYSTKFPAVSQDYRLTLFQHGIDHIGTHHIATGKPSFRLPAINTNKMLLLKCTCWMHWRVKGPTILSLFFLVPPPSKMTSERVFQQMRDVAADRDSDIFLLLAQSLASRALLLPFR